MTIEVVLTDEEVNRNIPYNMICQTRYSRIWNTMHRKIRWNKEFSEIERFKAEKIFCQAYKWSVGYGLPESVRFDLVTYDLWKKIERFCCSL